MEQDEWIEYKVKLRDWLKVFACNILELSSEFPENPRSRVLNYQLTKSGTSMYANFRAALRGKSIAEFYSKLCISVEEADETEMWIDLIISTLLINDERIKLLHAESIEWVKKLSSQRIKLSD